MYLHLHLCHALHRSFTHFSVSRVVGEEKLLEDYSKQQTTTGTYPKIHRRTDTMLPYLMLYNEKD